MASASLQASARLRDIPFPPPHVANDNTKASGSMWAVAIARFRYLGHDDLALSFWRARASGIDFDVFVRQVLVLLGEAV